MSFGLDFGFHWDTGIRPRRDAVEHVVTSSDEKGVYKIDGKDAVEEYSSMQRIRPYFLNMLAGLIGRSDTNSLIKKLADASNTMYQGILRFAVEGFCWDNNGVLEPLPVMYMGEGRLKVIGNIPEGTIIRKAERMNKADMLSVIDRLQDKAGGSSHTLIHSCLFQLLYSEYDTDAILEHLKKLGCNFTLAYTYGEIGNYPPESENAIIHGATLNAIFF